MVEDQQTHNLPKSAEGLALVAGLHGLDGSEALFDLLRPHVERTATIYDGLIGSETSGTLSKDRKSVVEGKSVSVRVDPGGCRIIKKKNIKRKWNSTLL